MIRWLLAVLFLLPLLLHCQNHGWQAAWLAVPLWSLAALGCARSPAKGFAAALGGTFALPLLPVILAQFPFFTERVILHGACAGLVLGGALRPMESLGRRPLWTGLLLGLGVYSLGGAGAAFVSNLPAGAPLGFESLVAQAQNLLVTRSPLDPAQPLATLLLRLEWLLVALCAVGLGTRYPEFLEQLAKALAVALLLGLGVALIEVWRGLVFRGQSFESYFSRGIPRSHRPLTDNNALGSALVLLLPLIASAGLWRLAGKWRGAWLYALALGAGLLLLYSSRSKAAYGALAVAGLCWFVWRVACVGGARRTWAFGVLLSGAVFFVAVQCAPEAWIQRLAQNRRAADLLAVVRLDAASEYLHDYRKGPWSAGWRMGLDAPFLGQGLGRFVRELKDYRDPNLDVPFNPEHENAHSQMLQTFAEEGLLGLLLEQALFWLALLWAWRAAFGHHPRASLVAGLAAGLCGLWVNLLASHSLLETSPAYLYAGCLGAAASLGPLRAASTPQTKPIGLALLVLFLLGLLPLLWRTRAPLLQHSIDCYPFAIRQKDSSERDRLLGPDAYWFETWGDRPRAIFLVKDVRPVDLPGKLKLKLWVHGQLLEQVELGRTTSRAEPNPVHVLKIDRPEAVQTGDIVEFHLQVESADGASWAPTQWFDSSRNALGVRISEVAFIEPRHASDF